MRKFLIAVAILPAFTGCASIVGGTNQPLSVETRAKGAAVAGVGCTLRNDKGQWFVTTPGSVTVLRSFGDMTVNCDKTGVEPGIATVRSSTKAMAAGNIVFGGLVGVGVDMATGAAYDYPTLITVEMGATTLLPVEPPASQAASGVASQ